MVKLIFLFINREEYFKLINSQNGLQGKDMKKKDIEELSENQKAKLEELHQETIKFKQEKNKKKDE